MGHVLTARLGKENIARREQRAALLAGLAPTHLDTTVEHGEHLRTVIDVPVVGCIGPVQTYGDAVERG